MKLKVWKKVLSLALAVSMILLMAACSVGTVDDSQLSDTTPSDSSSTKPSNSTIPDRPDLGPKTDSDTPFVPTARYVVTSDVHIRMTENNYKSHERLAQLYQTAYAYSDAQADYNKLDAIFFVGDITNNGTIDEYTYFFDHVKEYTREGTVARALFGNHESFDTGKTTDKGMKELGPKRFLEMSGYEVMDTTLTIGGNRFIVVSIDQYKQVAKSYYSAEKLSWLKQELDAAVAEDPTKPIFVLGHVPAADTVIGSYGRAADVELRALLDNYPQVIFFSGHTHNPITNPRSVWQKTFTAINTGSLAYISQSITDKEGERFGATAIDTVGSWAEITYVGDRNGVMYWIVETDQYDRVRLQVYNMETQSIWGETYIIDSLNPTDYKYANASKDTSDKPAFSANAALTLGGLTHKTVAVTIPQATSKDVVQNYRVELYQGDSLKQTEYRLSCTYYGDAAPKTILANFGNLEPATAYTIKVYAVNSWEKESDPLVLDFNTKAAGDTIEADVLNVSFAENGTAVNAISGKPLKVFGTPTVSYDESLGKHVASFDGVDDGYTYEEITAWYNAMSQGFSLETYVYIEGAPSSAAYVAGNVDSGGFGMYCRDGSLFFTLFSNVYGCTTPGVAVTDGQWMHVVSTYDGSEMCLYVNGQLAAQRGASGKLIASDDTSRFFAIGANSGSHNQALETMFNGKIADVKIYSAELSANQIAELYQSYSN